MHGGMIMNEEGKLKEELIYKPPVMKDDRARGGVGPFPRIEQPGQ